MSETNDKKKADIVIEEQVEDVTEEPVLDEDEPVFEDLPEEEMELAEEEVLFEESPGLSPPPEIGTLRSLATEMFQTGYIFGIDQEGVLQLIEFGKQQTSFTNLLGLHQLATQMLQAQSDRFLGNSGHQTTQQLLHQLTAGLKSLISLHLTDEGKPQQK